MIIGFNEAQLVYCHEFDWLTNQQTFDKNGDAPDEEYLVCEQDSYIKGV